jgi:hypothetical protein
MLDDYDIPPNHAIGDIRTLPKPQEHTRIYFQSINGMNVSQTEGKWDLTCTHLRNMEVNIGLLPRPSSLLGIQEFSIDSTNTHTPYSEVAVTTY